MSVTSTPGSRPRVDLEYTYSQVRIRRMQHSMRFLPRAPVPLERGQLQILERAAFRRRIDTKTAELDPAGRVSLSFTDDAYESIEYALEGVVSDRQKSLYQNHARLEALAMAQVREAVTLDQELDVSDLLFSRARFPIGDGTGLDVATPWNQDNSTPISDIDDAVEQLADTTGVEPEDMQFAMHRRVLKDLNLNAQVTSRFSGGATELAKGQLMANHLKEQWGIGDVWTFSGTYETGPKGAEVQNQIWPQAMGMLYVPLAAIGEEVPDTMPPCLGASYYPQDQPVAVTQYRSNNPAADMFLVSELLSFKLTETPVGLLVGNLRA
ncbi:MAG: hypothetical protein AAGB51_06225 [Planctomycetota bacterium]